MYNLQGIEGIFLFEARKTDSLQGLGGMRHVGGIRIRACRTTQMGNLEC